MKPYHKTLSERHWLPIIYYVRYKLFIMVHAAVSDKTPNYVSDILTLKVSIPGQINFCCMTDPLVYDVRNFWKRILSVADPAA